MDSAPPVASLLALMVVSSGHKVEADEWTELELFSSVAPAGTVEADELSCRVASLLSVSVVEELQLMTWFGLVVSEESRARRCLAASSTVPVAGGRPKELEEPVRLKSLLRSTRGMGERDGG